MFQNILAVKSALLHSFPRQRILVVGDIILDKYLWGKATRISPEAPVPVICMERETVALGGAANVANNLASLQVQVELAGFVGVDGDADIVRSECEVHQIGASGLFGLDDYHTITKTRVLADDRQLLRIDNEKTTMRSEAEMDGLLVVIFGLLEKNDYGAVILSDYAKGVCTPYLCARLIARCREMGVPVYVDPKGTDYSKYAGATAVKPNRLEIEEIAKVMGWPCDPIEGSRHLLEFLKLDFVAVTLGAGGIALVEADSVHQLPTVAREVFDVSGAGDTVVATLVAGLCGGLEIRDSVALANIAAAEVVARLGSTPISREDLLVAVQSQNRVVGSRKLYDLDELQTVVQAWRARGLKVALTNGCFDLLHAGHVSMLQDSAAQSDRLIVAINSDDSVRRLKGEERPLMLVPQRVEVLSALECVDAVVVFEGDTPLEVIETISPDFLIKGGDYTVQTVVGADVVQAYGGKILLVPLVKDISTSRLAHIISRL
jgi:D-beta-D-heptose 7-phosphate kinase/D-beta-D-heptose 1-phosphate adenosyltransferase